MPLLFYFVLPRKGTTSYAQEYYMEDTNIPNAVN